MVPLKSQGVAVPLISDSFQAISTAESLWREGVAAATSVGQILRVADMVEALVKMEQMWFAVLIQITAEVGALSVQVELRGTFRGVETKVMLVLLDLAAIKIIVALAGAAEGITVGAADAVRVVEADRVIADLLSAAEEQITVSLRALSLQTVEIRAMDI